MRQENGLNKILKRLLNKNTMRLEGKKVKFNYENLIKYKNQISFDEFLEKYKDEIFVAKEAEDQCVKGFYSLQRIDKEWDNPEIDSLWVFDELNLIEVEDNE